MKININFIDKFNEIIKDKYDDNYRTRKYREIDYFEEIMYVINSHVYWSSYRGKFNYKVLYNKHLEYINKGYYKTFFENILKKYINTQTYFIFKYQSTDTSMVSNKLGTNLPRNKYYKNKKGIKISSIVDLNGIPFSLLVEECNKYDSTLLKNVVESMNHNPKTEKYKTTNRYKQNFLADSGYDSKANIEFLQNKGYHVIIPPNKRNTKDENKLRKYTKKEKEIYKKRIIVENSFGWIKFVPKLMFVFEKKSSNYLQLLYLSYSQLIFNRYLN